MGQDKFINMFSLRIIILIFLNCYSCSLVCDRVSISYCNHPDNDPDKLLTTNCSLDQCRELCEEVSLCSFTEYLHRDQLCTVWAKDFSLYIQECNMIGAPKDVVDDCDIEMEGSETGCSVFREQDCSFGVVVETIAGLPSWEVCQQACNINQECLYWTWEREQKVCRFVDLGSFSCYRTLAP